MQNVMIKIEGQACINRSQERELEQWLHLQNGWGSVERCQKRQNVMMVDYDDSRLSRNQILQHLSAQGMTAVITSC